MYIAAQRKISCFKGQPSSSGDPTVHEWISDVKSHLKMRQLSKVEEAAFILENLSGKARQEIYGRGDSVMSEPETIFSVLSRVFGDGDSSAQLQQKFFSYQQGPDEDLQTCSLNLVEIYDRMASLDQMFLANRDSNLKNRLAEAVYDENLQREIRRLSMESPNLSFFDTRDQILKWMGSSGMKPRNMKKVVSCHEMAESSIQVELKAQAEKIDLQQKLLERITKQLENQSYGGRSRPQHKDKNDRKCWICGSTEHFRRNCPEWFDRKKLDDYPPKPQLN